MASALILPSFSLGEVAPALFGRFDVARLHSACSTLRNFFPAVQGGAYSRAGTAFVGFSKQTGRSFPPRMVPFQEAISQGLALEFGHQYMRVVLDGAYVTEAPFVIAGISSASPAVVTLSAVSTALSAVSNNGGVSASYAPGDTVTLTGGTETINAQLGVLTTTVSSLALNSPGTSGDYKPGDTITLAGGSQSKRPIVQVATTQVVSATIIFAGSGGSNGVQTLTGYTGTGTKWQVSVTVAGGKVTAIGVISVAGNYTVNPSTGSGPNTDFMIGGGFAGSVPVFALQMGVKTFSILEPGIFTANPGGAAFTQASSSGTGVGATFQTAVMAPFALSIVNPGSYTVIPSNPVAQGATSGTGAGATFNLTWSQPGTLSTGDWGFIQGINSPGPTQYNGQTFVLAGVTANTAQLFDVYGNPIDGTQFAAWASGGTLSRIYTLTTPYSETDLRYLKWTQSADVMSLCLVNPVTQTEYLPYDLARFSNSNWQLTPLATNPTVAPPSALAATAQGTGTGTNYLYAVTAVSPTDGSESIASNQVSLTNVVDIATTAGSIKLTWVRSTTSGVRLYNIYKALPGQGTHIPLVGAQLGFAGQAIGGQFIDDNIVPDFAQVPPTHANPFARGQVLGANVAAGGSAYTSATVITITTATGSGAVLIPIIVGGVIVDVFTLDPGQNYQPTDTATVTDGGGGSGASVVLAVGPQSGTYPSVVGYFQQRRGYADTLNNPDAYFFSQPGAFRNFDQRLPPIDSDAVIGSPWGTQVNGIQWMINMPAGLMILTGLQAWLLVAPGSFAANVGAFGPASQDAVVQPATGISGTVPPIKINYSILIVNSRGSLYYEVPYQLYSLSEPIDISQNSVHLFNNHAVVEHAWAEQPWKLLWAVRDDGILISLTFLKAEQVVGWARHDTQGTFQSVCSIIEPAASGQPIIPNSPGSYIDALYLAVQRQLGANSAYVVERMDNRAWSAAENAWCVDMGFMLPQPAPTATLTASSATGLGAVTGITGLVRGAGYSAATTAQVIDAPLTPNGPQGPGTGAVPTLTIVAGAITNITFAGGQQGGGYLNPQLVFSDPAGSGGGSGASAKCVLSNAMTFTASTPVFSAPNVGSVIRMGGGIAQITGFLSTTQVQANMLSPIVQLIPNTGGIPASAPAGQWTMTAPVNSVYVPQLAGATVTGLLDGNVLSPTLIPLSGILPLSPPASAVTIGLGYQCQMQTVYLDPREPGEETSQGQRKKVADVTLRLLASRDVKVGTNQPDGSMLSPPQTAPPWANLDLTAIAEITAKPYNALCPPLYTGDTYAIPVSGGFQKPGQVAVQQDSPLPCNVLALLPRWLPGDAPDVKAQPRQRGNTRAA